MLASYYLPRRRLSYHLGYLFLVSMFATPVLAQDDQTNSLPIPEGYQAVYQRSVIQDDVPMTLTRYERQDGQNTGLQGEHFSTLYSKDGTLMGFMNITSSVVAHPLPSEKESERVAREFFASQAPDLLTNMRITSIATYTKPLRLTATNETVDVSGVRVKAYNNSSSNWFWVVVGNGNQILSYERDVGWSYIRFQRSSEYWLDDQWLLNQGY
ncbi:hypothetical protein [Shewanella indica]|uniref:hypothetical protein n=1 Tax=Shewanella indica TaxID=768528 RepID=UPI0030079218